MRNNILAICDNEEGYAYRFQEYLNRKKSFPFQVQVFTKIDQLCSFSKTNKIDILMVSETIYTEEIQHMNINHVVVLAETGVLSKEELFIIKKYQSSEKIIHEILYYYEKLNDCSEQLSKSCNHTKLIGIYTPVGRCLQTSFALLLGEFLAKKKRVLYLNFEAFSGFGKFMKREYTSDLIDMMYLMNNLQDKFTDKFNDMIQTINGMDYIPPAFSFLDLSSVTGDRWIQFLDSILEEKNYEYVILDLSDNIQGLLSILQKCEVIYTITREDGIAMAKMDQYEKLLKTMEFQDIMEKTKRFNFPIFKNIPYEVEQLPFCELAKYVKAIIKEDLLEEISGA